MRLSNNEKKLLLVLFGIIFVGGNYFGYIWLAKKQTALELTYAQLRADEAQAKVDLIDHDKYAQRQAWIRAHEPPLGDEGDAKAQVLDYVLKGAGDNKLEVIERSVNDVEHGPAGACVNVSVKVKGSSEGLIKWLSALEQPDQFYAVSSFSLKVDSDQKSMVCSLQISRYFKEGS